jgi:hypothetical protein
MITLVRQGRFFNLCRASSLDVTVQDNYQGWQDVYIQKQHAVAVCTGFCTDSYLVRGVKYKKLISVLFHSQEWEQHCCFMTMTFDKTSLVAHLYQSTLTFATLPKSVLPLPVFDNAEMSALSMTSNIYMRARSKESTQHTHTHTHTIQNQLSTRLFCCEGGVLESIANPENSESSLQDDVQ